jgi:transposase
VNKKYIVTLTDEERALLEELIGKGKAAARKLTHARILLKADVSADGPGWSDQQISTALEVSAGTVQRIRQLFVEEGLAAALTPRASRCPRVFKLDGAGEAHLIALACSQPPAGQARWTLRLLAAQCVELAYVDTISHETVRQVLKKVRCSRGGRISGAFHPRPMGRS